ncbi:uncharacterized protein CELE_F53F4.4 [Caenorhabditis elegans]|uniref:Secreted protein n=1 Tax=Caenorhabditis elegans TaxID=6239 RepID=C6KRL9_CAEEL|nr:Secreted protein [Caenorhabditis elegans]CAZ39164.2 Secreted protein [Caenorhabditis elegans]|eukprot:NP_001256530.1 Uncharacterized protein CELE_F53F4.4 [Caenorhabditis elegans]
MLILFFFIFLNVLAAEDLIPTSQCPDNPTFCMLDLLKTWEELRLPETNATNILLPVCFVNLFSRLYHSYHSYQFLRISRKYWFPNKLSSVARK